MNLAIFEGTDKITRFKKPQITGDFKISFESLKFSWCTIIIILINNLTFVLTRKVATLFLNEKVLGTS